MKKTVNLTVLAASIIFPSTLLAAVTSMSSAYTQLQFCGSGPVPSCINSTNYSDFNYAATYDATPHTVLIETPSYIPGKIKAEAVSDLSHGTLKLQNTINKLPPKTGTDSAFGFSFTRANFGDTVKITDPNLDKDQSFIKAEVLPTIDSSYPAGLTDVFIMIGLQLSIYEKGYFTLLADGEYADAYFLDTTIFLINLENPTPFSVRIPFPPRTEFEWQLDAFIETRTRQPLENQSLNIEATTRLSYETPNNAGFTTGSGHYGFTSSTNNVPEPNTFTYLLTGLFFVFLKKQPPSKKLTNHNKTKSSI